MVIAISTVQRPNKTPYLDRCIESIRKEYGGIIHLIVGGNDTNFVNKYLTKDYKITFIGKGEQSFKTARQRAGFGYYTALKINLDEPLLVFEDDAVLEEGWYAKLQQALGFIKDDKFILSLILPSRESVLEPDIKVPSIQFFNYRTILTYGKPGDLPIATIITYSNTTGIYYPPVMLKTRLADFVYKYAVKGDGYYDIVIGQYMFRYNLPIYITVPALTKNIGEGTDNTDSSLGHTKTMAHIDYSGWDFKQP